MKIKHLISSLLLSASLVTAGALFASQKKAEKAEAATNSVTLAGSFNNWSTTANPLTLNGGFYTIERSFSIGDEFKVVVNGGDWVGYGNGVTNNVGSAITGSGGSNFTVATAGKYLIKAISSIGDYGDKSYGITIDYGSKEDPATTTNQFYVYDPHTILGSTFSNIRVYGFGQDATIKEMEWPGIHTGITQVTLGRASMYSVELSTSYPSFIMNNGTNQTGNLSVSGNTGKVLVIDSTKTGSNYDSHWDNADIYTDCPAIDGYFLVGDAIFVSATTGTGDAWKYSGGVKMNSLSGEGNKANYVLIVNKTVTFRARSYFNISNAWLNFGTTYDGTDGITSSGDNVQVVAGTYSIYVSGESTVWVAKGLPLDAFCSQFITNINNVCKTDGSTVLNDLKNTWSNLSTLFSQLTASAKKEISDIGFNGGSDADDPHKVVKAYHYIVTKYETSNCNDFIWNQNVSGTYSQRIAILGNTTIATNNTIIVVVVVGVAALAVGGYFLLRKKKEN